MLTQTPNFIKRGVVAPFQKRSQPTPLIPRTLTPKFIADIGTGNGGVAMNLARLYPQAQILAVEPEPTRSTYKNLDPFSNIRLKKNYVSDLDIAPWLNQVDLIFCFFPYPFGYRFLGELYVSVKKMLFLLKPVKGELFFVREGEAGAYQEIIELFRRFSPQVWINEVGVPQLAEQIPIALSSEMYEAMLFYYLNSNRPAQEHDPITIIRVKKFHWHSMSDWN